MAWTNTGGEKKTITVVCLWSTWGSPLWLTQREDKLHKHDMKKSWIYLTMSEEVLTAVFQSKKAASALFGAQEEMNASNSTTHFTSLLPLNQVATPLLLSFPRVAHHEGENCWGEGVKAMTPQEGSWCVQLTPAQLTSTHCPLTSPMAKPAVSISTPHWAPGSKLSSLPPCPGIKKHPQTHPFAKKHLPGLPHHSWGCEGAE